MEASQTVQDRVAALKAELAAAEAEETTVGSTPAPVVTPPSAATPEPAPVDTPVVSGVPEDSTLDAQTLPGGAAAATSVASAPVQTETGLLESTLARDVETPVLDALRDAADSSFVSKVRDVAGKLVDEGRILEGDLLTPSEQSSVTSTLVKAVGELIAKVGI